MRLFLAACKVKVDAVAANFVLVIVPTSRTRLLLDAAPNRGVERKKKIGPQFGPDVGMPTSVWDHPG